MTATAYPEHEKLSAVADKSQVIGDFLLDREEGGVVLAAYSPELDEYLPLPLVAPVEYVLADYFGIDLAKIEAEKRAMLAAIREANDA